MNKIHTICLVSLLSNLSLYPAKPITLEKELTTFNTRATPWITEEAIQFLITYLSEHPNAKILEFGAGGSTIWFSQITPNLVTIEHSSEWYKKVSDYIANKKESYSIDLRLLPRPYYMVCQEFPDEYFDLVLVDGRDRVRCIGAALRTLKKGGVMMLDNAERHYYQRAYQWMKDWEFRRTIQVKRDMYNFTYPNWQTNWWIKP